MEFLSPINHVLLGDISSIIKTESDPFARNWSKEWDAINDAIADSEDAVAQAELYLVQTVSTMVGESAPDLNIETALDMTAELVTGTAPCVTELLSSERTRLSKLRKKLQSQCQPKSISAAKRTLGQIHSHFGIPFVEKDPMQMHPAVIPMYAEGMIASWFGLPNHLEDCIVDFSGWIDLMQRLVLLSRELWQREMTVWPTQTQSLALALIRAIVARGDALAFVESQLLEHPAIVDVHAPLLYTGSGSGSGSGSGTGIGPPPGNGTPEWRLQRLLELWIEMFVLPQASLTDIAASTWRKLVQSASNPQDLWQLLVTTQPYMARLPLFPAQLVSSVVDQSEWSLFPIQWLKTAFGGFEKALGEEEETFDHYRLFPSYALGPDSDIPVVLRSVMQLNSCLYLAALVGIQSQKPSTEVVEEEEEANRTTHPFFAQQLLRTLQRFLARVTHLATSPLSLVSEQHSYTILSSLLYAFKFGGCLESLGAGQALGLGMAVRDSMMEALDLLIGRLCAKWKVYTESVLLPVVDATPWHEAHATSLQDRPTDAPDYLLHHCLSTCWDMTFLLPSYTRVSIFPQFMATVTQAMLLRFLHRTPHQLWVRQYQIDLLACGRICRLLRRYWPGENEKRALQFFAVAACMFLSADALQTVLEVREQKKQEEHRLPNTIVSVNDASWEDWSQKIDHRLWMPSEVRMKKKMESSRDGWVCNWAHDEIMLLCAWEDVFSSAAIENWLLLETIDKRVALGDEQPVIEKLKLTVSRP